MHDYFTTENRKKVKATSRTPC